MRTWGQANIRFQKSCSLQVDDGAGLEDGDHRFRVLTHEQGNFAKGLTRAQLADEREFSIGLTLLQAKLAFKQDPEAATGAGNVQDVSAHIGMDQLHRVEASKLLQRDAGEDGHLLQLG